MAKGRSRRRRSYTTGDEDLDTRVSEIVGALGLDEIDARLISEIVMTGLLLALDGADRGDLKIVNGSMKELRYASKVFAPYRDRLKVSVFGSSRTKPGDPDYEQARAFGEAMTERGWMVVTGAGPGSMEAANEGAGRAQSFGVNIRLPFEAEPNPVIAEDPKLVNFKYFFTRKLMFAKEASAFCLLPGGFGTLDETFEVLTLMQTGKSDLHPIVLLDAPGGTYWRWWLDFARKVLVERGYVSEQDLDLFCVVDDAQQAVEEICGFYRNFHSMRFVGDRLVLRCERLPDTDTLAKLTDGFSDLLVSGAIEPADPFGVEVQDEDMLDHQRLVLHFDRASYGRLRSLIDHLNEI